MSHPLSNDRIPLISPSMIVNEIMNIHKHRTCHQNLQVKQVLGSDIRRGRPSLTNWRYYRDLDQRLRFTSSETLTQDKKQRNNSSFNSNNNTIIINSGNFWLTFNKLLLMNIWFVGNQNASSDKQQDVAVTMKDALENDSVGASISAETSNAPEIATQIQRELMQHLLLLFL